MLITIWGRDGSGKSTLADALGALLAQKDLVAIIDTDLTQPILPVRLPGTQFGRENSLGRAIAGTGSSEVKRYLHLNNLPVTISLYVTESQALRLAELEQNGIVHLVFVARGADAVPFIADDIRVLNSEVK